MDTVINNPMTLEKPTSSTTRLSYRLMLPAVLAFAVAFAGCASSPPKRINHACKLFKEKPKWYKHTHRAAKKWRTDAPVMLAIMRQESGFNAKAKPQRKRFFGIPLKRPSSAFGYPQALDSTWNLYRKNANNFIAQRDRFSDAIDFIGWYVAQSRRKLNISPNDGYRNYLAYHEGWKGYARGTYKRKKWLPPVAKRVAIQANKYRTQLKKCGL